MLDNTQNVVLTIIQIFIKRLPLWFSLPSICVVFIPKKITIIQKKSNLVKACKGQLISEGNFGVFKHPKMGPKFFEVFLPLLLTFLQIFISGCMVWWSPHWHLDLKVPSSIPVWGKLFSFKITYFLYQKAIF